MNRRDLRSSPVAPKREQERETPPGDEGWCWGKHPVLALLKEAPDRVLKVLLLQKSGGWEPVLALCAAHHIPLVWADAHALDRCCEGENHQGIAAQMATCRCMVRRTSPGCFPKRGLRLWRWCWTTCRTPTTWGPLFVRRKPLERGQ